MDLSVMNYSKSHLLSGGQKDQGMRLMCFCLAFIVWSGLDAGLGENHGAFSQSPSSLGWCWFPKEAKGFLYRKQTDSWLFSPGQEAPGWFYDYSMQDYWHIDHVPDALTVKIYQRLWQAEAKVRGSVTTVPSHADYPIQTGSDGNWIYRDSGTWTSGFWPGILWLLYDFTGDTWWESKARSWTAGIEAEKSNTKTHDLGFMLYCSFGQGFRLTGDPSYREILVEAAASLDSRYNPFVGGTRSWSFGRWDDGANFTIIADNMMNLELLYFGAAQDSGNPVWADHALQHGLTTREHHVREDGGSFHCVIFSRITGEVLEKVTHQGYADSSTWARGQAWLIHGFATSYRESGDLRMLEAAQTTADTFIARLPEDTVPFWDFDDPQIPDAPRDSSAAAIAASGLIELAQLTDNVQQAEGYWTGAHKLLEALLDENYFNDSTQALIAHGTYNKPAGNFDSGLVWGDYYLLEAMLRYLQATGRR
jgi:unsaturated chondroitin disaccharide hydrolase